MSACDGLVPAGFATSLARLVDPGADCAAAEVVKLQPQKLGAQIDELLGLVKNGGHVRLCSWLRLWFGALTHSDYRSVVSRIQTRKRTVRLGNHAGGTAIALVVQGTLTNRRGLICRTGHRSLRTSQRSVRIGESESGDSTTLQFRLGLIRAISGMSV